MIPTSPLAYLHALMSGLLPAGENVPVEEIQPAPGVFVLTARPRSARAIGILLGKQGRNADAIRRLLAGHASMHGWTVAFHIPIDEVNENVRRPEAAR